MSALRLLARTLGVALALQSAVAWGRRSRALVPTVVVPAAGLGGVVAPAALFNEGQFFLFYTGGLSYLLLDTLFGVELVYRHWRFRPYDGSITDPLFRKVFPPRGNR